MTTPAEFLPAFGKLIEVRRGRMNYVGKLTRVGKNWIETTGSLGKWMRFDLDVISSWQIVDDEPTR